MNKVPLSFAALSALEYGIESWQLEKPPVGATDNLPAPLKVLAVAFRGSYASDGTDSAFMEGVIARALLAWDAHGLILDFRGLDYGWGDRMQNVLNAGFSRRSKAEQVILRLFGAAEPEVFPTAVIVSGQCRAGLESLIAAEMVDGYAGVLVATEEEAINHVANEWLAADPLQSRQHVNLSS